MFHTTLAESPAEEKAIVSLKRIFGDSITVQSSLLQLTQIEKDSLAHRSMQRWANDSITVYTCRTKTKTLGYGFVDDVKGKVQFITYLVAVRPTGEVQDIDILAYRESYGGEIAYGSFRKQFRDKSVIDKLEPGKDIKNISGATISVRAITSGVKKILATFNVLGHRLPR